MTPSLPTSRETVESQVPDEFICPLTLSIMVDPVMDAYGHNFEKSAIMAWIYEGNTTCPLTRRKLKPRNLANNTNLKDDIEDWKRKNNNNISVDCCSVPNEKGGGDQVVFGILDFGENQRKGKRSSKASKQSSKANHRLDIVTRLQQREITTSGSKQTEETEAFAENFLRSLNDEQLEALNMICDINSGCDTALLEENYMF
jgi:hypothetical protein